MIMGCSVRNGEASCALAPFDACGPDRANGRRSVARILIFSLAGNRIDLLSMQPAPGFPA